jgi:hypothetical protein
MSRCPWVHACLLTFHASVDVPSGVWLAIFGAMAPWCYYDSGMPWGCPRTSPPGMALSLASEYVQCSATQNEHN